MSSFLSGTDSEHLPTSKINVLFYAYEMQIVLEEPIFGQVSDN